MQLVRDLEPLPEGLANGVIALGNFDGVHLGHAELIQAARNVGRPVGVMTFAPHPRAFFQPEKPIFPITAGELKAEALASLGVDFLWTTTFNAAFSNLTAEEFVIRYLVSHASARHVVAGFNFYFGSKRTGTPDVLRGLGDVHGFGVTIVSPKEQNGDAVSSSGIRRDLEAGRVDAAAEKLGRFWTVRGTVVGGAQRGTELGFPTANVTLDPRQNLHHGIYAVRILVGDRHFEGAAYFGKRPTFDNGQPVLEVFLFDYDDDLYGQTIDVSFVSFIREDAEFADGDDLSQQMALDCEAAKAALAAVVG